MAPIAPDGELVVVGNGMVGHRLLTSLADLGVLSRWHVTVFCEERRTAYDRVNLSQWFDTRDDDSLAIAGPDFFDHHGIDLLIGDGAVDIDPRAGLVRSASGRVVPYDRLVLATGSAPFVPPVDGRDRPGAFVYRTIDDLADMARWAERPEVRRGVVIGGGLLGLEAATPCALSGSIPTWSRWRRI